MKTYHYQSDKFPYGGTLRIEGSETRRLPLVVNSEVRFARLTAIFTMLLDHFGDEMDSEIKARILSAGINRYILRRADPYYGWRITEPQLNDPIASVLGEGYQTLNDEAEQVTLDYISGQRRGTLRLQ